MPGQRIRHGAVLPITRPRTQTVADVYNDAGEGYIAYADGDPLHLFSFKGQHGYADRRLWSVLAAKLADLRSSGANSIRILDAGCGPGTWLRRLVTHARELGFASITAHGFDIAGTQIVAARRMASSLAALPGVDLSFAVADLAEGLPEPDNSADISLCIYSVLSHLPPAVLPRVCGEIARMTRGHLITTVRGIGSPPTIFIDSIENARHFELDHHRHRCEVELRDGRRLSVGFHLFDERQLRKCFAGEFEIEELCGLDIFTSRFLPDRRWNPASLHLDRQFLDRLAELEEAHAHDPRFIERATHLMLVGRRCPHD